MSLGQGGERGGDLFLAFPGADHATNHHGILLARQFHAFAQADTQLVKHIHGLNLQG